MKRFLRFMDGRYGIDKFSQMLIVVALIASFLGTISRFNIIIYIGYIPLTYAFYRIFSRNINKRIQENYKFMGIMNAFKAKISKRKLVVTGTKTHKYYKCPKCKQTIRVPKGKGKICITCPKCRNEFIKRT